MKITDLLKAQCIDLKASPKTKEEALSQAVKLMAKGGNIKNTEEYKKLVFLREEEGTTGIGEGIAIPHGKGDSVKAPGLSAMVIPEGVDFNSLDNEPVTLLFLIAAPNTKDNLHLDVLSRLSTLLMDEDFTTSLKQASSVASFIQIIDKAEQNALEKEVNEQKSITSDDHKEKFFIAVTACPTGIAHTYMAAESLEKAARSHNCSIKVETRGSSGAKNVVTREEIERADCIIVAADTKVPMDRFAGKRVIECQVSDGIGKADQLIERAQNGDVPILEGQAHHNESEKRNSDTGWHQIYMHLMNGISHMLPFVVGGGILIAIAFLIDSLGVDMESLSIEERANFGTLTPAAALFKGIGGLAFGFMLPVLAGFISMSIADRPGLAVGFVGGIIAANGKSGFLGALAAGFLAGCLVLLLKKLFEKLPSAIEKLSPVLLYPFFGILIIGLLMTYIVEPPIGALNVALNNALASMGNTSKIVLGLVLAGMMAVDMGGPFNKAAYVFGTASIIEGNYPVMAAVMIGGMVPPCALALACYLFKSKFTVQERESAPALIFMGLAFITEGAIPFAAKDPIRVIPCCIAGSALAGALSMAFGCTLMAPHGGIFVFPVVEHALLYLAALAAGTVLSAVLLGITKRKAENL